MSDAHLFQVKSPGLKAPSLLHGVHWVIMPWGVCSLESAQFWLLLNLLHLYMSARSMRLGLFGPDTMLRTGHRGQKAHTACSPVAHGL
jgi:hypothetical protein